MLPVNFPWWSRDRNAFYAKQNKTNPPKQQQQVNNNNNKNLNLEAQSHTLNIVSLIICTWRCANNPPFHPDLVMMITDKPNSSNHANNNDSHKTDIYEVWVCVNIMSCTLCGYRCDSSRWHHGVKDVVSSFSDRCNQGSQKLHSFF